jgi:ABC-type transport system substrate-binding protein
MLSFKDLLRRPAETVPLPVWIVAIALLMGIAFTLACSGPAATPIPTPTGAPEAANTLQQRFVIALSSEPENLSPIFMDFYAGNWKFFNGLISYDQDLNLVPDLGGADFSANHHGK